MNALLVEEPAFDTVTRRACVVVQSRPVVSASTWVISAMRAAVEAGRVMQLVTPVSSRLTAAVEVCLTETGSLWAAREPRGGYYDGLTGLRLRWDGETFAPALGEDGRPEVVPAFRTGRRGEGRQLVVNLRVDHAATATTTLGSACATLAEALTGGPPAGWGTAEPVTEPWREEELTAFVRARAPQRSWLTVRGGGERPFEATVDIRRSASGLEESIAARIGYAPGEEIPGDVCTDLASDLAARSGLATMSVGVAPGRTDLTVAPCYAGPAKSLGLAVGSVGRAGVPSAEALAPGTGIAAVGIGDVAGHGVYYRFDPDADAVHSARRLDQLMAHLRIPELLADEVGRAAPPLPRERDTSTLGGTR